MGFLSLLDRIFGRDLEIGKEIKIPIDTQTPIHIKSYYYIKGYNGTFIALGEEDSGEEDCLILRRENKPANYEGRVVKFDYPIRVIELNDK